MHNDYDPKIWNRVIIQINERGTLFRLCYEIGRCDGTTQNAIQLFALPAYAMIVELDLHWTVVAQLPLPRRSE